MKKQIRIIVNDKKLRKDPKVKKYIKFMEDQINSPDMLNKILDEVQRCYMEMALYGRYTIPPKP